MNITSYNVTDVAYHYIGLRVIAGLPADARREEQTETIARNVRKYVTDRALRLMLPEPRGTYESAGKKICQELTHLQFANAVKGSYELTAVGNDVLTLLNNRQHKELRRVMAKAHLQTYDNLRAVVKKHLEIEAIWRPIVDAEMAGNDSYIAGLLVPTFGERAVEKASLALSELVANSAKKKEDALHQVILQEMIPETRIGVPMFRSMCDRLISLRLLNQKREWIGKREFWKTYTPCSLDPAPSDWHISMDVPLNSGGNFPIYLSEPDMTSSEMLDKLLEAVYKAFHDLPQTAGYYDLPDVRDNVVEFLKIPEAAFDEGIIRILDMEPRPLTMGLQYDGITGRRKPLVHTSGATQIYNLLRRA